MDFTSTNGTIDRHDGTTRDAVRFDFADGASEVLYLTLGMRSRLVPATAAQAATFLSEDERAAREADKAAYASVSAAQGLNDEPVVVCDAGESVDIDGWETHDVVCVAPAGHGGVHVWRESWQVALEQVTR